MEFLNKLILLVNDFIWSYILIAMLIVLGLYFTFRTKFVQFGNIKEMFKLLGEGSSSKDKSKHEVSSFQAFCIGTASRVGTGNLAGVASAIAIGGPGAVFWMWLIALIGSASAFIESTLAQIYKVKDGDNFRGGPAYYMEKGLKKRWMGVAFSILIIICFGFAFNSVQSNTITAAFNSAFGINKLFLGALITIASAIIIFGGVKSIAKISTIIVPIMAVAYILVALFIIITNITELPAVFKMIFSNAFGVKQVIGGGMGAALLNGIKRGLFSNEAGMGSAPNAAATATVSHPVKQGLIQTLGVFTDTLIICTCTAFIVLLSSDTLVQHASTNNIPLADIAGIEVTQIAISSQIGSWGQYFIAFCIFFFAFSSIIGNYYYGETNIQFISTKKIYLYLYRVLVIGMVLFGSVASMQFVWSIADVFMGLMAILNLIAIALLSNIAIKALQDYMTQRKAGKNPVFYASSIPELGDEVEEWRENEKEATA
ncbi:MAG: alanine:cation symporter family protein [Clostridium sp.]|uniref:alanine/glycine:cation symporter family protein n=1 Tax=Clostridium sp. TaxID=1506 RepID=UPI0025BDBA18|nr:alanine/glycine:cation symporter family protein [Clostridium sp.]MBS4957486.1 alanine:cation symporter family protein [Clostridium sp.]